MNKINIPPTYFFSGIIISVVLMLLFPSGRFIPFPYSLSGIIVIILGFVIVSKTYSQFKISGTTHQYETPQKVLRDGVFRYTRNPMYVGMLLVLIGIATCLGNLYSMIGPLLFFLMTNFVFIPFEEKLMEQHLGAHFLDYKNTVRRWI
jgi:protein-S-isoprenylcysteine O-methyltransferase Ste14